MIGDRLGKWVIFKELGRGGMGRVFLAQEEIGGRQAAIKVLGAELAQEVGFLQRFQREIETLSTLDHPGIVRFYESGFENGLYFYAMEYVEGQSLEEVLKEQGKLPWQDVLDIALQICPALRHVHDHGIIHRDIKPPNILRSVTGQIKLTDFGIAKVFASQHLTSTGGVVGTAEYLSPEQTMGKPVSKRSDLYSLGVVLYFLLTGRPPFEGSTFVELLHKHRYGQFDKPSKLVHGLPYELDELVCQLLEKEPAKRPPDCLVLGRQLEALRKKLERKGSHTLAGVAPQNTVAENRTQAIDPEQVVGPATLMSRLMRAELQRQMQGNWFSHLFNRAWVLASLLAVCLGILVWTFWPMNADTLFARGSELMASESTHDWEKAWREYLGPLETNFPEHPYREKVDEYKKKLESSRDAPGRPSEAQRFFQQGERLRQEGSLKEARQVWINLVVVFQAVPNEKAWVHKAEQGLLELDKVGRAPERWQPVKTALQRAETLRNQGQRAAAEEIWRGIEQLYGDDPWAGEILLQVAQARKN